jgi:predicted DsbA family dithiol-disulfide isomerase
MRSLRARGRCTLADMLVEIYSDVVCPWCTIGKARFEKALAMIGPEKAAQLEVVWRPYQLDPTAPKEPMPVSIGYAKKFGGPERAAEIIANVTNVAAAEGITFRMDIAQRANTFDAHRLIAHALDTGGVELQHRVKQRFLDAYFCEGVDVGSPSELARLSVEAGLFPNIDEGELFLGSTSGAQRTRDDIADGIDRGVSAVPTFVFDGKWSVPGAQDPDTFVRVLNKLFEQTEAEATADGDACAVDGSDC